MDHPVKKILEQKKSLVVATVIKAGGWPGLEGKKMFISEETVSGSLAGHPLATLICEKGYQVLQQEEIAVVELPGESGTVTLLLEPMHPAAELLVLGGGHIAQPLVAIAAALQYEVTVVDDRPGFANRSRFPGAKRVLCEEFDAALKKIEIGPYTSVVIVTRGHRYDMMCLERVMDFECGYVGMIGSRRRVKLIRDRLLSSGVPEGRVNRIHMPIGLDIGAQTPGEIAVSIMAELISVRRGGKAQSISATLFGDKGESTRPLTSLSNDRQLLQKALELAAGGIPVVMATIVNTKGSTPRKAGTKMFILQDGRTWGTIGGGCGEAEVRREALILFDEGGCRMHRVMLDADTAAEEGMVCGGLMDVFLERLV